MIEERLVLGGSPPLWRLGTYVVAPDGTLRRRSISYADELRPVEEAA